MFTRIFVPVYTQRIVRFLHNDLMQFAVTDVAGSAFLMIAKACEIDLILAIFMSVPPFWEPIIAHNFRKVHGLSGLLANS